MLFVYFKRTLGVFEAPFIFSFMSLFVILKQFTTIYFSPYYSNHLIFNLGFIMITCNIFFVLGYHFGSIKSFPKFIRVFKPDKIKFIILIFSLLGMFNLFFFTYRDSLIDGVVVSFVRNFSTMGLALCFSYLLRMPKSWFIYFCILLSCIPILYFIIFIKGSRGASLVLITNFFSFVALSNFRYIKFSKFAFISILLLGTIISSAISEFRVALLSEESNFSIFEIDYLDIFKRSFIYNDSDVGMDLGNAALGIDFVYNSDSYDYGLVIWNKFVYNFVPGRFLGDSFKSNIQYSAGYEDLVVDLTHNITVMTGYFDAFSSFSFFGCFLFLFVGFLYGIIWKFGFVSDLFRFIYFFTLPQVPLILTHSIQYFFVKFEFAFLVLFFIYFAFYKYKFNKI